MILNLSDKPKEVLDYIIAYKQDYDGVGPSMSEIGQATNIRSNSNVSFHLDTLEAAGEITCLRNAHGDRVPRGIQVTGGRWIYDNHG